MVDKENDSKEAKESEKNNAKSSGSNFGYYLVILVLIILAVVLGYLYYQNSTQVTQLQSQVSQLNQDKTNLTSQITGYVSEVDSVKNFSKTILVGNVPFWNINGNGMVIANLPLGSSDAKKMVYSALNENVNITSVKINKNIWNVSYCDSSNSCGNVIIDEKNKTYEIQ